MKFTEAEERLIIELYLQEKTKAQISEIIGKTVNSGNLQKIKKKYDVTDRDWSNRKRYVVDNKEEILRLANLGYNSYRICEILNIDIACRTLFHKYIKEYSTKFAYVKYDPLICQKMIKEYSEDLMSIIDLNKKYGYDTHRIQDILIEAGVLRTCKDTHKLKKDAGRYNYTGTTRHSYKSSKTKFSKKLRNDIRNKFNYTCRICQKDNDLHIKEFGKQLLVHHILPYETCKKNNIEDPNIENNLVPVCFDCHQEVHKKMRENKNVFKILLRAYKEEDNKLIDVFDEWFNK